MATDYVWGDEMEDLFSDDENEDFVYKANVGCVLEQSTSMVRVGCKLCDKTYSSKSGLKRHHIIAHTDDSTGAEKDDAIGDTACRGIAVESLDILQRKLLSYPGTEDVITEVKSWLDSSATTVIALVAILSSLVPSKFSPSSRINMTKKYHQLRISKNYHGLTKRSFHMYLPHLWSRVIAYKSSSSSIPVPHANVVITDDTRQSLYYIAGFFLRKLRLIPHLSEGVTSLIETWAVECGPITEVNSEWTSLQNRGGLVFTNATFNNILLAMEQVCANNLTHSFSRNFNLRDYFFELLIDDQDVQDLWSVSCCELRDYESNKLFAVLAFKFCGLRSQAYAKTLNSNISSLTKQSKSLRKQLKAKVD